MKFLCQVAKTQTQLIIVIFVSQSAKSIENQTRIGKFPHLCSSRLRIFHFNFAWKNENWPQKQQFSFLQDDLCLYTTFANHFRFLSFLPGFDFFHFCLDSDYRQFWFSFKKNPIIFDFSPFHFLSIVITCWNLSQRHYRVRLPITCIKLNKFVKCLNI